MLTLLNRLLLGCIFITCLIIVYLLSTKPSYANTISAMSSQNPVSQPEKTQGLPSFNLVQRISEKLTQPAALDIDSAGRVYILNGDSRVQVFSPKGKWLFSFPKLSVGKAKRALDGAMDLKIVNDQVIIADSKNSRLVVFSTSGKFIQVISTHFANEEPSIPVALAINENTISFSDRRHHRVCQLNAEVLNTKPSKSISTNYLMACFGNKGSKKSEFNFPFQLVKDKRGFQYVVDVLNASVKVFNRFGKSPLQVSRFGLSDGELYRPNGIALDSEQRLYISDAYLGDISVFKSGKFLGLAQGLPTFNSPNSLRWLNNTLWVVDYRDNAVYQYQPVRPRGVIAKRSDTLQLNQEQQVSQKECISCHLSWQASIKPKISKIADHQLLPVASQKMCDSCHHGAVIDSRHAIKGYQHPSIFDVNTKDENTAETHKKEEQSPAVDLNERQDGFPEHFPLTEQNQISCGSCHTPHNASKDKYTLYSEHKNNWLRISNNQQEICTDCHESKAKGADAYQNNQQAESTTKGLLSHGQNHPIKVLLDEVTKPSSNDNRNLVQTGIKQLQQGLPKVLAHHGASLDADKQLQCQSCHQIHGGFTKKLLTEQSKNNQLCSACHEQQSANSAKQARKKGIHPVNIELEQPLEFADEEIHSLTCQTCHSAHDGSNNTALLVNSIKSAEAQCIECHQEQNSNSIAQAKRHNIHPVNIELNEKRETNQHQVVEINGKEVNTIGCLTCHSVHQGKANTAALVSPVANGELCNNCHQAQANIVNSDHDLRLSASTAKNSLDHTAQQSGVCGSCHTMHQGTKGQLALSAIAIPKENQYESSVQLQTDMACLNCHQKGMSGEEKALVRFSHPKKDLILRSNNKKMPLVDQHSTPGEFGEIACKTCHDPHNWQLKSFDGLTKQQERIIFNEASKNIEGDSHNSFLRNKGVKDTFCVDCHRDESLFKYRYYHDKRSEQLGTEYIE